MVTASFGQIKSTLTNPSVTNPQLRSPVSGGTIPSTAYRSGLVTSPRPTYPSGNLIVTGNVGGGKHFRGVVPYNAVSDFGGRLGSGTLDTFLRRSTIPQNYYSGGHTPFYSQTGTVTRIVPGTNMVITPPSTKIRTQRQDMLTQRSLLSRQSNAASRGDLLGLDRVTFFPLGTERVGDYPLLSDEQDEAEAEASRKTYQIERKQFTRDLKQLEEEVDELERQLLGESGTVKPSIKSISNKTYQSPLEITNKPQLPDQPGSMQDMQEPERTSVYKQMLAEYEQNKQKYEELFGDSQDTEQQEDSEGVLPGTKLSTRKLEYKQPKRIISPKTKPQQVEKKPKSELEILAESQRVLSERQSFAVRSQDKFNQYMRAAEQYMQQGKYYLAADAYSMATIYKPLDPLGYAGKCHALFAAGDYLSSALYLNRAIDMFNGYVDFKIDIVTMIGDMDRVEKRIADIKTWVEINGAPELHFLLAYVYMQLDRLDKASQAADAAYNDMQDVPAVGLLKAAIDKRLGR